MSRNDLIIQLHAAFRAFDERAAPQGLYAIEEYQSGRVPAPPNLADWQRIMRPALESLGYGFPKKFSARSIAEARFYGFGEGDTLNIELVRFSKIKVRRYGDTYRLDPHLEFAERWKQLRLAGRIRSHAGPFDPAPSILFLVGFAKGARGFNREFTELHEKLGATEQSATHTRNQWPDPHGRGFETLCASWYWPRQ